MKGGYASEVREPFETCKLFILSGLGLQFQTLGTSEL